jgi:cytochrome c5
MRTVLSVVISCLFIATGFSYQALASDHENKVNAEELFESKCSVCHASNKPKSKKWSKEKWEKNVKRMIKKRKSLMTEEEANIIIDYLAETYGK